ncbi:MAG: diacylglycerol kinase family lipid kinase [Burkholderiales bacterium]|nr:diacylglycerol kinase family lipid kinase [Anaerolineae bacterium]
MVQQPETTAAPAFKSIHVILNPASGQATPVLAQLNTGLQNSGMDWEILITKKAGDAKRFAEKAVKEGVEVVAAFGGDGTVMEVASGLMGSKVPLAILPGGTANVMSSELNIPRELPDAIALVAEGLGALRWVDIGQVRDQLFLLRLGIGLEAEAILNADREDKNRMGRFAYVLSGLQALREPKVATYQVTIDGKEFEAQGVTAFIANSGNIGVPGVSMAPNMSVSDGLLDLLVVRSADLGSLVNIVVNAARPDVLAEPLQHWQGREIKLVADMPQMVEMDGEEIEAPPLVAKIIPKAVRVIVPMMPEGTQAAASAAT